MTQVFVVTKDQGYYESWEREILGVFASLAAAQAFSERHFGELNLPVDWQGEADGLYVFQGPKREPEIRIWPFELQENT